MVHQTGERYFMRILAVTNMYPTPQHPTMGNFIEQQITGLKGIGLAVDVMVVNRLERGMGSYFTMGATIREHINQFRPDVVHVMYGGILAERMTHFIRNTPTVVSFCGSDLLGERMSGPLRGAISECGVFASHVAARQATGIVVKSRILEEALPPTVSRSKVRIIPNGISLERFKPLEQADCRNKLGWDANKFHVLFCTNFGDPCKRPDLAQAAVEAANRSGLNAELHTLRGVPHEEVSIWLNASNAVLLTSLYEGSPNVIKEALACNVPIVSLDVGDVRERITGLDGCYIALPDPHDLGVKLGLVGSRGRRVAGRERVQHLSLEQTAFNLESFYREVLESYRSQGVRSCWPLSTDALLEFASSIRARSQHFHGR
jgi:glycosyltransferase involved in cell wall biosynthesis